MIGRFLLPLLVIAAVTIQSCVAGQLPSGRYRIASILNTVLTSEQGYIGEPLSFNRGQIGDQTWIVMASGEGFTIQLWTAAGILSVSPSPDDDIVSLQATPYEWLLKEQKDGFYTIEVSDDDSGGRFAVSQWQSHHVVYAVLRTFTDHPAQHFRFERVDGYKEVESHCRPRRIQRGSFYHQ
ncbi:hypothetical protein B0O80DRAFT_222653 [Mortierella sp. GBAus27b]|nr:hypothetical protein BGX31_005396 [Mortierella sp. GBA43]KAI8346811.1 hypothetical protein B0O80DRAFT_222653 [Mortierella sp. GBAus27b]